MINTDYKVKKILSSGFTLVELLIVIAIIGTLAVVVLVAINPVQQLAKTRDTGRKSTTQQLGHSLEAYAVNNNGSYVPEATTWMTSLVTAGELTSAPGAINYAVTGVTACTTNTPAAGSAGNGYCYATTGGGATPGGGPVIIYSRLEATADISRCTALNASYNRAYAIYSSALGKGGVVCKAGSEPVVADGASVSNWLP